MKLRVFVHEAEEGGFWAEVLALPGCVTEGDTMEALKANLNEVIMSLASPGSGPS